MNIKPFGNRQLLSIIALCFVSILPAYALDICTDKDDSSVVRIGVLYRQETNKKECESYEGCELWRVVSNYKPQNVSVCLVEYPYPTEPIGFKLLADIRDNNRVDLVLGPTDTGVYMDALQDAKSFANKRLLVVSPIVTASNQENPPGWIFKTNLNIGARAEAIMDLLRQLNIDSIGIVYEDSAFGRNAEQAVRQAAKGIKEFRSVRYKEHHDLSTAVASMMQDRPAVIGILSSRKDFGTIVETINDKNHRINPYCPHLFSLIDIRHSNGTNVHPTCSVIVPYLNHNLNLKLILNNAVSFVSVGTEKKNEVTQLSEKTLAGILSIIGEIGKPPEPLKKRDKWAEKLRAGVMGALRGSMLGINDIGVNVKRPPIFQQQIDKGEIIDVREKIQSFSFFRRILLTPETLYRRFGYMPFLNILTVIILVIVLNRQDLRKWNDERELGFQTRYEMAKIVSFNIIIALIIYFFMLTTGLIEWESLSAAILVGFGYPALLKSTLMQTTLGESVGLADLYDKILRQLNDNIMEAKYRSQKSTIDHIAMTNLPSRMYETLEEIYGNASPTRKRELIQRLDDELDTADGSIGRRIVLARRIQRRHTKSELVERMFLTDLDKAELVGPDEILQAGLDFCNRNNITLDILESKFKQQLESLRQRHPQRAEDDEKEVQKWIDRAQTDRGDMRGYLRWLFMQENFNIKRLVKLKYLPNEANIWNKEEWRNYSKRASEEMQREQGEKES